MSKQLADMPAFPATWVNEGEANDFAPDGQVVAPGGAAHLHGMTMRQMFALELLGAEVAANGAPAAVLESYQRDKLVEGAVSMADLLLERLADPVVPEPITYDAAAASREEKEAIKSLRGMFLHAYLPAPVREFLTVAARAISCEEDGIPF